MPFWNLVAVFTLFTCPEAVCMDFLSVASLMLGFEYLQPKSSKSCYIFRINMTPQMKNCSFTFIWYSQKKNPATCTLHMKLFFLPHVYKEYMKCKGISFLIPETVHYVCVKNMKSGKWVPSISDGKYLPCPSAREIKRKQTPVIRSLPLGVCSTTGYEFHDAGCLFLGKMSYHCRFVYSSCSAWSNKTKTLYLVD